MPCCHPLPLPEREGGGIGAAFSQAYPGQDPIAGCCHIDGAMLLAAIPYGIRSIIQWKAAATSLSISVVKILPIFKRAYYQKGNLCGTSIFDL